MNHQCMPQYYAKTCPINNGRNDKLAKLRGDLEKIDKDREKELQSYHEHYKKMKVNTLKIPKNNVWLSD